MEFKLVYLRYWKTKDGGMFYCQEISWKRVQDIGWIKHNFLKLVCSGKEITEILLLELLKWCGYDCGYSVETGVFCFAVKRWEHSVLCVQWPLSSNSTPSEGTMSLTCQKASVSCEEDKIWPSGERASCWMWRQFSLYLGHWNR